MGPLSAVLFQSIVHQGDDLIQHSGLESLLGRDTTDQAIDPLDVCGAAKKGARSGRRLSQAFGGLGVLFEGNQIGELSAQVADSNNRHFVRNWPVKIVPNG